MALECDILIIGGGPHGLNLCKMAEDYGLSAAVVEKNRICNLARSLPPDLDFASDHNAIGFDSKDESITVKRFLEYYKNFVEDNNLSVFEESSIISVSRSCDGFLAKTDDRAFLSKKVVLATGMFSSSKKLGVPGEGGSNVFHKIEEKASSGKNIIIVGSGNSAANAILRAARDNNVTWLVRRQFDASRIFYKWRSNLEEVVLSGQVSVIENSSPIRFLGNSCYHTKGELLFDKAYILIGYNTDFSVFKKFEIIEKAIEIKDKQTCETNVEGVYIFGSLAGRCTIEGQSKVVVLSDSKALGNQVLGHISMNLDK